jgi:hypothetical protein
MSKDYLTHGLLYVILGIISFVGGVASLFDSTTNKIYVGLIICGPILFVRGLVLLHRYYSQRIPDPPTHFLAANARELYAGEVLRGVTLKEVVCEQCSQDYLYVPGLAAKARFAKLGEEAAAEKGMDAVMKDCAVAPCPRCGAIQKDMYPVAREEKSEYIFLSVGVVLCMFSVFFFVHIMEQLSKFGGLSDEDTNRIQLQGLADAASFLLGVGCLVWSWRRVQKWDPNSQPVGRRLQLAREVSLLRDDYLALARSVETSTPVNRQLEEPNMSVHIKEASEDA